MTFPKAVTIIIIVVLFLLVSGCVQSQQQEEVPYLFPISDASPEVVTALDHFSADIIAQANAIDLDLSRTAATLSGVPGYEESKIAGVLWDLYNMYPLSVGVTRIGPDGREYKTVPAFIFTDITASPEFWEFNETAFAENNETLLLGPMYSKQNGEVLHIRHPVYDSDGEYDGYVGISFIYSYMINRSEAYFMQTNTTHYFPALYDSQGEVVYHPDTGLIGENVMELSEESQSILKHTEAIFMQPEGMMKYLYYLFGSEILIEHTAVWKTIDVYGREFRPNIVKYEFDISDHNDVFRMNPDDLSAIVGSMFSFAKREGTKGTLSAINDPNGIFSATANSTLFAYDINGTLLAHSSTPELIGQNRMNARGSYGLRYIGMMSDRCTQGGGFVHYHMPVSDTNDNLSVLMLAYVLPVDENWFVGASFPMKLVIPDIEKRDKLTEDVVAAQKFIYEHGKDAALAEFMDHAGTLQLNKTYILALDYNGTVLSAPIRTNLAGTNALGFTSPHGESSMRELLILARQGGGYLLLETENPDGTYEMHLLYVEPVDDTWCIASWVSLDSFEETRVEV
ncbi:MAG: cache domain-containing protein [Methanocorpusculum sp.]|nr:cache domain-containing protein [Methanocorpusculum sp.]MDE2522022.1 cache domain-containing protein [Methanocorpusculum sp.]MDE2524426.1 cache domain-containing protein [Methanocorpusculum sp.]